MPLLKTTTNLPIAPVSTRNTKRCHCLNITTAHIIHSHMRHPSSRNKHNKQSDFLTNTRHDLSRHPPLNENKPKRTTSAISFSISPGFNQANQCKESRNHEIV
eukprot:148349_1